MSRNARSNYSLPHIFGIGQAEMLGGCHITEKICPGRRGYRPTDSAGDMVVTRGYIGHQRAEYIEGSPLTDSLFQLNISLNLVKWQVSWPFHHGLDASLPGALNQLTQSQ